MSFYRSVELASSVIILFSFPYSLVLIVVCVKNNIPSVTSKVSLQKVLPDGICSKRELVINYSFFIVVFVFVVIIAFLFTKFSVSYYWYLLVVVFIVASYIVVINKTNVLIKLLRTINNDLDIELFIKLINEVMQNNINPEMYNIVKLIYDLNKGNIEDYISGLDNLNQYQKPNFENLYKVFFTNDVMLNIESLYVENNKLMFSNVESIELKMIYYYTRGQMEKADECAKKLIESVPCFKEYIKVTNDVLNRVY